MQIKQDHKFLSLSSFFELFYSNQLFDYFFLQFFFFNFFHELILISDIPDDYIFHRQ